MLECIQFSVFVVCGITPFRIYVFYLGGLRRLCLYDWVVYFLCFCVWIFRIHRHEFIISIFALGCVVGVAPWQGSPCMERHLRSVWPRRRLGWHWPASTLLALAGPRRIQGWRGSSPLWLLPSKIIPALQVVLLWVTFTSACHSRYNLFMDSSSQGQSGTRTTCPRSCQQSHNDCVVQLLPGCKFRVPDYQPHQAWWGWRHSRNRRESSGWETEIQEKGVGGQVSRYVVVHNDWKEKKNICVCDRAGQECWHLNATYPSAHRAQYEHIQRRVTYLSIQNIGYHHDSVDHSCSFVCEQGVHANDIEGLHILLKVGPKIMRVVVEGQVPQY